MIWIRADANSEIGTGHVMRCLSVAAALQACGEEVCFLLADASAVMLLEERKQKYIILHTDFKQMEGELPDLRKLAKEQKPAACLIDSYFVTPEYLECLGGLCRTVYMDDVFRFPYAVDMLINYNIYGDSLPYREQPGKDSEEFLLGTSYAPLRQEFCTDTKEAVREHAKNVLITTGGSDKYNLAGKILRAVMEDAETSKLQYHVVSGAFNAYFSDLKDLEKKYPNIQIHQNVTNMAELMRTCDMALTAGGSTMYELCAVGVPIICFSFVDNQERIVETFVKKEMVCYGGNYLLEKEAMTEQIVHYLKKLAANPKLRAMYAKKERNLVDGRGATRIAKALLS